MKETGRNPQSLGQPPRAKAVRIAVWYAVLSGMWIFCSGWVLHHFVHEAALIAELEIIKGWGFVLVTAVVLGLELSHYLQKLRHSAEQVQASEKRLRLMEDNLPGSYVYQ